MKLKRSDFSKRGKVFRWVIEHRVHIGLAVAGAFAVVSELMSADLNYDFESGEASFDDAAEATVSETANCAAFLRVEHTGIERTATGLGAELSLSAREVNKKLVEKGMMTRLPCGQYVLTDLGKEFGKETIKTTRAGHTFSNLEWDTSVISRLLSEE